MSMPKTIFPQKTARASYAGNASIPWITLRRAPVFEILFDKRSLHVYLYFLNVFTGCN